MKVDTHVGTRRVAVLIPTRHRERMVQRQLKRMPFLNHPDVYYGVDESEYHAYASALGGTNVQLVVYQNTTNSVGFCRDELRKVAMDVRPGYQTFVVTDDNAFFDEVSFTNLVRAQAEWPTQPCIMAGMHQMMGFFVKDKKEKLHEYRVVHGLRSWQQVNQIFLAIPRDIYKRYAYPAESLAAEDRHLTMWAFSHGIYDIRQCMDAVFTKSRQQEGGTGTMEERMRATGLGLAKLALDFPVYVGCSGVTPIKWSYVRKIAQGYRFKERLPGGGLKREADVLQNMVKS